MSKEAEQKKGEQKIILFLNRDLERKALDRSVVRDELIRNEEEENNKQDD
ncbi:MAG: hypothetical protein ABIJ05_05440 [Patescibacteria group bacterium]